MLDSFTIFKKGSVISSCLGYWRHDTEHNNIYHSYKNAALIKMTVSIETHSVVALSIVTLSVVALSIVTLSIATLSIVTLSKVTLSIVTLSIVTLSMVTLSMKYHYAQYRVFLLLC